MDHPDNLVTLADYARDTAVVGAPTAKVQTCDDCPVRIDCRRAGYCQWGDEAAPEPQLRLRLVEPPDIVA